MSILMLVHPECKTEAQDMTPSALHVANSDPSTDSVTSKEKTEAALTEILRTNDYVLTDWGNDSDYRVEQRNRIKAQIVRVLKLPENAQILMTVDYSFKENALRILVHDAQSPFIVHASFSRLRFSKIDHADEVHDLKLEPALSDLTDRQLNQRLRAHFKINEKLRNRPTITSITSTEGDNVRVTLSDEKTMKTIGELVCDKNGRTIFDTRLDKDTMSILIAEKAAE